MCQINEANISFWDEPNYEIKQHTFKDINAHTFVCKCVCEPFSKSFRIKIMIFNDAMIFDESWG